MALRAALKDRGRIVREEADARIVEGRRVFHPRTYPLFRCRLEVTEGTENRDQANDASVEETPTLMTDRVDAERNPLVFNANDKIEVESRDFNADGTKAWNVVAVFQVDAEPKPIRKKRKVIGWMLRLKRLEENPAATGRTN